ncbi:MAG: hypothetical protein ACI837_003169 [Crocinitomicaceae bacterium]|jgi:hypothetical protein
MKQLISFLVLGLVISLTSCIEIIDDLAVNKDGSGTFKYTVNLSSSKIKLNSYLALDSLDGKKVPSISDITVELDKIVSSLKEKHGISNVSFDANYTDFIFKLKLDFASIPELQNAIKTVVREKSKGKEIDELNHEWLTYSGTSLVRSVPELKIRKASTLKPDEISDLKKGTYTSISRFDREVAKFDNKSAILAKNKKAVMMRTDPYSLIQKSNLLDNTIYLLETDSDN